jgi:hypothetical protein
MLRVNIGVPRGLPHYCIKPTILRGMEVIHAFSIDTRQMWMFSFTPRLIYPEKKASGTHCLRESVGSIDGQEALRKTELFWLCRQWTIVSSTMFDVLTNIHLKCAVIYSIRLRVAKVIYAASMMVIVLGKQAFVCFSIICCPLEFWFEVPCLNFDSRQGKKLWQI